MRGTDLRKRISATDADTNENRRRRSKVGLLDEALRVWIGRHQAEIADQASHGASELENALYEVAEEIGGEELRREVSAVAYAVKAHGFDSAAAHTAYLRFLDASGALR